MKKLLIPLVGALSLGAALRVVIVQPLGAFVPAAAPGADALACWIGGSPYVLTVIAPLGESMPRTRQMTRHSAVATQTSAGPGLPRRR